MGKKNIQKWVNKSCKFATPDNYETIWQNQNKWSLQHQKEFRDKGVGKTDNATDMKYLQKNVQEANDALKTNNLIAVKKSLLNAKAWLDHLLLNIHLDLEK